MGWAICKAKQLRFWTVPFIGFGLPALAMNWQRAEEIAKAAHSPRSPVSL